MVYQSQNMRLQTVHLIARSASNEIQVCENLNDSSHSLYSVLVVKDHEILKSFIEMNEKAEVVGESALIDCFSGEGGYVVIYPYRPPRPLKSFYVGGAVTLPQAEEICINLIIECMTGGLPWPVLYLVLTQGLVNISRDRSVYLSYAMDLSSFSVDKTEKDCVVECAKLLLWILSAKNRRRKAPNSLVLLQKKINKRAYTSFRELYKDLELSAVREKKRSLGMRIRIWFEKNRDIFFRVILVISVILAAFVVLTFLSNLILGDVPWLRIFIRNFERIGLESLLQ